MFVRRSRCCKQITHDMWLYHQYHLHSVTILDVTFDLGYETTSPFESSHSVNCTRKLFILETSSDTVRTALIRQ
jgi:hypothetical protein